MTTLREEIDNAKQEIAQRKYNIELTDKTLCNSLYELVKAKLYGMLNDDVAKDLIGLIGDNYNFGRFDIGRYYSYVEMIVPLENCKAYLYGVKEENDIAICVDMDTEIGQYTYIDNQYYLLEYLAEQELKQCQN